MVVRDCNPISFTPVARENSGIAQLFLFLLTVFSYCQASAVEPIILEPDTGQIYLDFGVEYINDSENSLTIEKLLSDVPLDWYSAKKKDINLGYVATPHWFRVTIHNASAIRGERYLELAYALHNNVDIYHVQGDKILQQFSIDNMKAASLRPIHHRFFVVPLAFEADSMTTIYVRVVTSGSLKVPLSLWTNTAFNAHNQDANTLLGGLYGISLVMAIYNLLLYLSIREKTYLYYVVYVSSWAMFQAAIEGTTQLYLWSGGVDFVKQTVLISMAGGFYGISSFTRSFLNFYRYPKLDAVFRIIIIFCALMVPITFLFPYSIMIRVLGVVVLTLSISMCIIGYWAWFNGIAQAKLFAAGWTCLLMGVFCLQADHMGLIPSSLFSRYASAIGGIIEVTLLSVALADRYKHIRQEKIRAQMQALDNLRKADTLKSEFLATISHELRTPMIGIVGYLEMLKDHRLEEGALRDVVGIEKSTTEMMQLVDRILDFTQLQAGILHLEPTDFNLEELLHELKYHYNEMCTVKGLKFSFQVERNVPHLLHADRKKLHDILYNLLDNAVKFTDKGTVTFSIKSMPSNNSRFAPDSRSTNYSFLFRVQDSGSGINIENRQKIFAAFAQADGSFSRLHSGLGLGLAMCRHFVKLMNGDLTLVSEQEKGSRFDFIVDLDVIDSLKKTEETVLKDIATICYENPNVLIVEDNVTNQIVLKRILESYGFTVLTADNGLEALKLLETAEVDLIFMDCQMPVMNGFDTTQCIRSGNEGKLTKYQAIPIIAVTANVLSGDRERCIESGMNDYLKKPVKKLQIKEKIQQWLTA